MTIEAEGNSSSGGNLTVHFYVGYTRTEQLMTKCGHYKYSSIRKQKLRQKKSSTRCSQPSSMKMNFRKSTILDK
jgi:hypothetical protein